ncbi:MAG TPA: RNA-binding S4 domain-containing protein [Stellaceae bacterium]|nr:RNA-binding S4 domain-containing protein [Stellaceae bacterium]
MRGDEIDRGRRRLDQWLWFARFAKSRSLAARLCVGGEIAVNGVFVTKPNHALHVGDVVALPQGGYRRTVRVLALGLRRGPAVEARTLYEEAAEARRIARAVTDWVPLLGDADAEP